MRDTKQDHARQAGHDSSLSRRRVNSNFLGVFAPVTAIFEEDRLAPIAPLGDMVRNAREHDAWETSHGRRLARSTVGIRGYCTCHRNSGTVIPDNRKCVRSARTGTASSRQHSTPLEAFP